ncbi:MAG TPA: HlyD family efflux transporter periplasmic adaptor subunit [Nocardioides sp.]|uniref:efflux RND transporter periplasmic adaptor subunit n=1 Tax=Nocardioides sp. TaxID=35761 RepID=UPI002E332514|nr:HlyD family efflux transporter periplasmic adaptor subunit [Nocardioides sp.]HEX3932203.1 HlyD family efflux transporter periplasmic adaptor subunit [Nocardioides sp.]
MPVLSRLRHPGRAALLNGVLVLALALVGLMTYRAVAVGRTPSATASRTTTVDTGTVTATVTSSGNIEADRTLAVDFEGSGGTVKAIYVKPGDEVRRGQRLATVLDTSARQGLASARVQLESAEASYDSAVQGQTPAQRSADEESVSGSQVSLRGAELALTQARQSAALDRRQRGAAVTAAERTLRQARSAQPVDHTAVQSARSALATARQTRASTSLADRHQVQSQEQALASARQQLASAKATVAVNEQPATSSAVAQAQAQVDSARIGVEQARSTLDEATLRAPEAGRVAAVNGTVGQSSTSSSGSSSDSSSTATGFVTLVSARTLEVTADVAEADINDVKVGQPATVTISADDKELKGTVAEVADTSTVTNNVVEYAVTVRVDRGKGVKLGQTAQLVITTGAKQSVLRVSSSALTTIGNTTTATVRAADGTTTTRQVTTGLEGDSFTEILSGLQAGDVVVLPRTSTTGSTGFSFPAGGGAVVGGGGFR